MALSRFKWGQDCRSVAEKLQKKECLETKLPPRLLFASKAWAWKDSQLLIIIKKINHVAQKSFNMNVQDVWWVGVIEPLNHWSLLGEVDSDAGCERAQETHFVVQKGPAQQSYRLLRVADCTWSLCESLTVNTMNVQLVSLSVWPNELLSFESRCVVTHMNSVQYCNGRGGWVSWEGGWLQFAVLSNSSKLEFCFLAQRTCFSFAWFTSSVCAYWGHSSKWCCCRFTFFFF